MPKAFSDRRATIGHLSPLSGPDTRVQLDKNGDMKMGDLTLQDLAKHMRKIDFGMLTTKTKGGALASRPMSNNGEVEYDGDSYFFTDASTTTVSDIEEDDNVGLTYTGTPGILGAPPIFIAMEGKASLIRDKAQFAAHWHKALDRLREEGHLFISYCSNSTEASP